MYHFDQAQLVGAPRAFAEGEARSVRNGAVVVAVHKNHARDMLAQVPNTDPGSAFRGDYANVHRQVRAETMPEVDTIKRRNKRDTGGKINRRSIHRVVPPHHNTKWVPQVKSTRQQVAQRAARDRRAARVIAARRMS